MIETKSPLLEEQATQIDPPDYSEKEEIYLKGLKRRMENAKKARDTQHIEFDGMDYVSYYNLNEKLVNTYIEPKRNKEDSNFQSGTIRIRIMAMLASIVNLDLSGDISAFDKNGFKIQALGDAMEDVMLKTNELDNDEEKKYLRQYELLKQGTVFVEEIWDERSKKEKKMKGKFSGKLSTKWDTKIKKAFARPARNIIPGLNVYLGDITKYNISDQPFIFTVDTMPWTEAELLFGEWDRWDNVPKNLVTFQSAQADRSINWRLLETEKDHVEIVRYQDKWANEFAVIINGVLMTPAGLPLPWGYEDYNIAQQNLEPIHSKFAYGKSLAFKLRNKVAILDEMLRMGVLKTQKSFQPPYLNISGRILTNRVFMPGKITHGVPPGTLIPVTDKEAQGVTPSELAMITQLEETISAEDTPKPPSSQHAGKPTVPEILDFQRQAKLLVGLTVFSLAMLEWKLEWLRLQNLLVNWFNPEDRVLDEARGELRAKYREVSVPRQIDGQGMGLRMVIPTKQVPTDPNAIMQAEDIVSKEQGMPVRFIFLNPDEVKSSKLCWQITIVPKDKRTSETAKLLFRAEMQDAMIFGPMLNLEYLGERFANVWGENPQKLLKNPQQMQMEQMQQAQAGGETSQGQPQGGQPQTPKTPSPAQMMPTGGARQAMGMA